METNYEKNIGNIQRIIDKATKIPTIFPILYQLRTDNLSFNKIIRIEKRAN